SFFSTQTATTELYPLSLHDALPIFGGPSYVDAMQTRMRLTTGRTISYALGLTVADYHGSREVSHSGSTAGYQTFLARFPEQQVSDRKSTRLNSSHVAISYAVFCLKK